MTPSSLTRDEFLKKFQTADLYRSIFDNAIEGIFQTTPAGQYLNVNPALARMYGYDSPEDLIELLTRIDAQLYVDEKRRGIFMEEMLVKGFVRGFESQIYCKDRSTIWISENARAVLNGNGAIIYYEGMVEDITDRKRLERETKDANEKIEQQAALLDKTNDSITLCDLAGRILFWNKGAEAIYGWTSAETANRFIHELSFQDNNDQYKEACRLTLETGKWTGESPVINKEGNRLVVLSHWSLIRDSENQPHAFLGISYDITDRKNIEAQLMRSQRMESIGTLAGGIAHDLNNILTPILMSIEILKATSTHPKAQSIIETIELTSRRGSDIVRQVLSFARGIKGDRIEVSLRHLVADLQALIKNTLPKDIQFSYSIPHECWSILGDPTQLHQILLNLCVNARDAMPHGGSVTLKAENVVIDQQYAAMDIQAKPGNYVLIEVADTGTGIAPEILDKIFDPFFTTKQIGTGTGLGLSTVMAIVKSHDGFIDVSSEDGKGTVFKLHLPAGEPAAGSVHGKQEIESVPRGRNETILIVDDEASVLTITAQTLETFGYQVLTAADGIEAIALYAQHRQAIAVVLTDISMPIMDGRTAIRVLKKMAPEIKIIATSGLKEDDHLIQESIAEVKYFIAKPYTAGTLLKALRVVLDTN